MAVIITYWKKKGNELKGHMSECVDEVIGRLRACEIKLYPSFN